MTEPVTTITLAAVGFEAIKEGIKFLYDQAGELIKWWREKKDPEKQTVPNKPNFLDVPSGAFEPAKKPNHVDEAALGELEGELIDFRKELANYADGTLKIDTKNEALLKRVAGLRTIVEALIEAPLTFRNERRVASSDPNIEAVAKAKVVKGILAGIVVGDDVLGGYLKSTTESETVEQGATQVAVKIEGSVGGSKQGR
jgi:hypothetical protein